jgi:hypothetical protein
MKITRRSILSGIERTRDLNVTHEAMDRWRSGTLIQDAFPDLSADDREFLMSGITPTEWEKEYAPEPPLVWSNPHVIGYLVNFLNPSDPRGAVAQIGTSYISGWNDFNGFQLNKSGDRYSLAYPNDRPMRELSRTTMRGETIVLFEYDWVAVIQPNGSFKVARLD